MRFAVGFHPKNWSIGKKIIFLGLTTTFVSLGSIVLALGVVTTEYSKVRTQLVTDYQNRVDKAVSLHGDSIRIFADDYAYWDEMYTAVAANDRDWFVHSTTGSLETFQASGYWIYRNDGTLMHEESLTGLEKPVTLQPNIVQSYKLGTPVEYFEIQNGQLVHFAATPITDPTRPELKSNGFMVVAKIWDQSSLDMISGIVGSTAIFSDDGKVESHLDEHVHILEHFKDQRGAVVSTAQFTFIDHSLQLTRDSLLTMILITFVLGGGLIYVSYTIQYHWFVDPIAKLITSLKNEYGDEREEAAVLVSHDELEILSFVVADHIEKLQLNKRLSLAVEASTNGIAITDLNGTIEYVNDSWTRLNGYTSKEAMGSNPRLLHSGKTPQEVYTTMWNELKAGHSFTTESIVNKRKDGSEYDCRLSVYPITEHGSTVGYVGIQQNISHRKEVDRMKTEFISMASHQLRTPLSAMRWFGELLLQKKAGDLNPKQSELVQNFYDSTLRMISLVNALLNISRIESGRMIVEPVPTHLENLVESIIVELSARIDAKKLVLHREIDTNLPVINVDPQLVREVYSNLLTNAVKYTPEGGTVTLSIKTSGDSIRSEVSDTGVGIPKGESDKVFSKFFRAKNVTSLETDGTGLGLYLVKSIITSSHGDVGFESTEGTGATFWFTLPLSGMEKKSGSVRIT